MCTGENIAAGAYTIMDGVPQRLEMGGGTLTEKKNMLKHTELIQNVWNMDAVHNIFWHFDLTYGKLGVNIYVILYRCDEAVDCGILPGTSAEYVWQSGGNDLVP